MIEAPNPLPHAQLNRSSLWTNLLRQAESTPTMRLVIFPHAGAGPNVLLPMLQGIPEQVEVIGVTLPGRERRLHQDPATTAAEVMAGIAAELSERDSLPTVFFGHSMGAYIALGLASVQLVACQAVIVSGQLPPTLFRPHEQLWREEQWLNLLVPGGEIWQAIKADESLRNYVAEILKCDLALSQELAQEFAHVVIGAPLVAMGGLHDPLVPEESLAMWSLYSSQPCRIRLFDGGHFYLLEEAHRAAVGEEIYTTLAGIVESE
jgi:surfactin synthase thioesterase subunit